MLALPWLGAIYKGNDAYWSGPYASEDIDNCWRIESIIINGSQHSVQELKQYTGRILAYICLSLSVLFIINVVAAVVP